MYKANADDARMVLFTMVQSLNNAPAGAKPGTVEIASEFRDRIVEIFQTIRGSDAAPRKFDPRKGYPI